MSKKYIFVATIKQLDRYYKHYAQTAATLKAKDYALLDDWLSLVNQLDFTIADMPERQEVFYDDYLINLRQADLVVCDISVSSRTVLYQIAMALFNGVKVVCVRKRDSAPVPPMLAQIEDKNLTIKEYSDDAGAIW
jgi:hypothetical protein